jgi:hypothetical protein
MPQALKNMGGDVAHQTTGVGICLKSLRHFAYFAACFAATFGTRPAPVRVKFRIGQEAQEL